MKEIKAKVIGKTQGFYEVKTINDDIFIVKLKGLLKRENSKLNCVIGDKVKIDIDDLVITEVLPRKNLLLRPLVSNIDYVAIVGSIIEPKFDIINFCKNLLWVDKQGIETILIINKIDLINDRQLNDFIKDIKEKIQHIKIFPISISKNIDLEKLIKFLKGKTIVLSGISGVGKSSLVNNIIGEKYLEIGNISKKTKKGKNTTIITKYFQKKDIEIFDTPGYSSVEIPEFFDKREIMTWFPEFLQYLGKCKFRDCMHIKEPNCYIKEKILDKTINEFRYEFYRSLVE